MRILMTQTPAQSEFYIPVISFKSPFENSYRPDLIKARFEGYVYLPPKTHLVNHYRRKYGFRNTGTCMFTDTTNSKILIHAYHESSDKEGIEDHQEII